MSTKLSFTFTFTEEQTNLILTGLAQLPYAQSAQMIQMIQQQAQEQIAAQKREAAEAAKGDED